VPNVIITTSITATCPSEIVPYKRIHYYKCMMKVPTLRFIYSENVEPLSWAPCYHSVVSAYLPNSVSLYVFLETTFFDMYVIDILEDVFAEL
jgi:hypothetical protein